jgi:hypothetical protein
MAPTSCFNGQVHRLPDSPKAYGAMISRPMAAPAQSRYTDLTLAARYWAGLHLAALILWLREPRQDHLSDRA